MNYAAQYHIGYNHIVPTTKAAQATQANGSVCRMDAKTKGRRRNTKGQTQVSTHSDAANGFLKCSFIPKLVATETVQSRMETERTERDF